VNFIHPLALLGLAAAAIPALLHLLQRRIPPEMDFPAVRYLSEAERESARRLRLRHLLLLILRTALIVTIVMAAARPLVRVRAGVGSAHEPTAVVVILDNSPSAAAVVDGGLVLDRLRVNAHATVASTTPADRAWLMLCDGVVRGGTREELLATIDSTHPGWQRLDLVDAVRRAARLVDGQPLPGREVEVLSDLQRTAFGPGDPGVPAGARVLVLAAGRAVANQGIAAVHVSEGAAIIELSGPTPQPVPVTIRIGSGRDRGEVAARGLATLGNAASGDTGVHAAVTVSLPAQTLTPGWWVGEAALEPDELRADDRRPFAWRVAPPARVTATPGAGPFVTAALGVLRDARRIVDGSEVVITGGDAPPGGAARVVVEPPADPALLGQANRALLARGVSWRWGETGTPGPIASAQLPMIAGAAVSRRYRIVPQGDGEQGADALATVNGEPWLVRAGSVLLLGSRLDTAWTALPAASGFVPFIDGLVNRIIVGESEVATAEGAPHVEFRTRGTDTLGATVFGPDPRESDLSPAPPALATAALGGSRRVEVLSPDQFAAARFAGTRRADLSAMLLVLALILAAAELGVATRTH